MIWVKLTNDNAPKESWVNINAICNIKSSALSDAGQWLVVLELSNSAGIDVTMTDQALSDFRKLIGIDQKGKK